MTFTYGGLVPDSTLPYIPQIGHFDVRSLQHSRGFYFDCEA